MQTELDSAGMSFERFTDWHHLSLHPRDEWSVPGGRPRFTGDIGDTDMDVNWDTVRNAMEIFWIYSQFAVSPFY